MYCDTCANFTRYITAVGELDLCGLCILEMPCNTSPAQPYWVNTNDTIRYCPTCGEPTIGGRRCYHN